MLANPYTSISKINRSANYNSMNDISNNDSEELDIISDISFNFAELTTEDVTISDNTSKSKKIIIALDNDECIGSWSDLSLLYSMLRKELDKEPDVGLFSEIMVKTGCIRPYMQNFFEKILDLKKKGIIYKIFMFTAASNSIGWVSFLSKILENWMGESLYDGIIYKEMIEEWHIFNKSDVLNELGYIKNMNMIRELIDFYDDMDSNDFHIVAIDDRPGNIVNGIAIGVKPFKIAINLIEVLRLFVPDKFDYLVSKYKKLMNEVWENYMRNPSIYTNVSLDIDILLSMERIDKILFYNLK